MKTAGFERSAYQILDTPPQNLCLFTVMWWSFQAFMEFTFTVFGSEGSSEYAFNKQWCSKIEVGRNTQDLADSSVLSKQTSQWERKEVVTALFHLCSGQWTCSILNVEKRPHLMWSMTPCITAYHEWCAGIWITFLKPVTFSKRGSGRSILIEDAEFHDRQWCHLTRWCYRIILPRESKNELCVMINGYYISEKKLN